MTLFRRRKTPSPGVDAARRELEESERLLEHAQRDVFAPLRVMRERNNVTELARRLIHGTGG